MKLTNKEKREFSGLHKKISLHLLTSQKFLKPKELLILNKVQGLNMQGWRKLIRSQQKSLLLIINLECKSFLTSIKLNQYRLHNQMVFFWVHRDLPRLLHLELCRNLIVLTVYNHSLSLFLERKQLNTLQECAKNHFRTWTLIKWGSVFTLVIPMLTTRP